MRLIVRGDDAGLCESVNRAIIETVQAGIVRNVSVMAPTPAFDDAARRLRELPDVCLGLHATLTSEWVRPRWQPILPAAQVPSLVDDDGYFLPTTVELYHREPSLAEAVAEIQAQLAHARAAGLPIAYLDEHMGVGWLPGLRAELVQLARREGLIAAEEIPAVPAPETAAGAVENPADAGEALLRLIGGQHPDTYVLITHPGYDEPELRAMHLPEGVPGTVAAERDSERRVLTGARARALITGRIELLRFTDLLTVTEGTNA